jgi:hypothetical protein
MVRLRLLSVFSILACALTFTASESARAWGNRRTHPDITDVAFLRAQQVESVKRYLRDYLGLDGDVEAQLELTEGVDTPTDAEFFRFQSTKNCFDSPVPGHIKVEHGGHYDPAHLLRAGVFAEDVVNARARHHFHDPLEDTANAGLDNRFLPVVDVLIAQLGTVCRGELTKTRLIKNFTGLLGAPITGLTYYAGANVELGSFDFTGRSALARALNRPSSPGGTDFPSQDDPRNLFALPDAERYLYRAITASTAEQREHYLALHFLTLGHIVHLLEDQTSPGHVRNDFVIEHVLNSATSVEHYGEGIIGALLKGAFKTTGGDLFVSRPYRFLSNAQHNPAAPPIDLGHYDPLIPAVSTDGFDVSNYWDSEGTPGADPGLAQVVNANFFSQGSMFNYPSPNVRSPTNRGTPGADTDTWIATLPERDLETGALVAPERRVEYISSRLVPHLAALRFHNRQLGQHGRADLAYAPSTDSTARDYIEILWPLAIDYTAKFLAHYLSPRLDIVPIGGNRFKLENLTPLVFEAQTSDLQIVYEDESRNRHSLSVGEEPTDIRCEGEPETFTIEAAVGPDQGTIGDLVCTLPANLGDLPAAARPHDFWVVVRGRLGERGQPVEPDSDTEDNSDRAEWRSKDFVVLFARATPRVYYHAAPDTLDEVSQQVDLYWANIPPDLIAPDPETTAEVNFSARFRASPTDDFYFPRFSRFSGRLAFKSDRDVAPEVQAYALPGEPNRFNGVLTYPYIFDANRGPEGQLNRLGVFSLEDPFPSWVHRAERQPGDQQDLLLHRPTTGLVTHDAEQGQTVAELADVFPFPVSGPVVNNLPEGSPYFDAGCVVHDNNALAAVETGGRTLLASGTVCVIVASDDPSGVGTSWPQLVTLDASPQSGQATPLDYLRVEGDRTEVRSCAEGCDMSPAIQWDVVRAEFSPDGSRVVASAIDRTPGDHTIAVFDLATRQGRVIPKPTACAHGATWLPDNEHVAWLGKDGPCGTYHDVDVYVARADGTEEARRVTRFADNNMFRDGLAWSTALTLPAPSDP